MSFAQFRAESDDGIISADAFAGAFAEIMDGKVAHEDVKLFLERTASAMNTGPLLAIGARALRERMVRVQAPAGAIDVCGTGGDGAHTLNISTAVAFVVAGAGVPVAKHGNRAMSSKCGAADVLEALGVKLTGDVPTLERCLREAKVAFLFAQNHHPAMRHVAAARRELGKRTIFNLIGPLSNPAGVTRQLLGVFSYDYAWPIAEALRDLGAERAWIVHGYGALDELSGEGENDVVDVRGKQIQKRYVWASDAYLSTVPNAGLKGGDAAFNAGEVRALLEGAREGSDYREVVQLNAAAALVVAGRAGDLAKGAKLANDSIGSGAALAALDRLIALSQAAP